MVNDLAPSKILEQVSAAVPAPLRKHIIVVGSLAAGYHFFRGDASLHVQTKDVDCVLAPRSEAARSGKKVARQLLAEGWRSVTKGDHAKPGSRETLDGELPAVRLWPPDTDAWNLEFLTLPDATQQTGVQWLRVVLPGVGHFGLPSFRVMSLVAYRPVKSELGISYARPEMMALANLVAHPRIAPQLMSTPIEGRDIKRSNKDLGRVLALARLAGDASIQAWHGEWEAALKACYPRNWKDSAASVGSGLRALLGSDEDLDEAIHSINTGLLNSSQVTIEQMAATGRRLLQDAIEPLEARARSG